VGLCVCGAKLLIHIIYKQRYGLEVVLWLKSYGIMLYQYQDWLILLKDYMLKVKEWDQEDLKGHQWQSDYVKKICKYVLDD
jgi:hypothetical protein